MKINRELAPVGCAYVAPLFKRRWFRWNESCPSGTRITGSKLHTERITGLQVFDGGEWHPVMVLASDWCEPWDTCMLKDVWKGEVLA